MKYSAAAIDTNVVVAGLLTGSSESPTAKILDGMRSGAFPFLLSTELLAEYRKVLLRGKIRSLHGLSEQDVDLLLTVIAANAIVREPEARTGAPDAKDDHLWSLLQSEAKNRAGDGRSCPGERPAAEIGRAFAAGICGLASGLTWTRSHIRMMEAAGIGSLRCIRGRVIVPSPSTMPAM